MKIDLIIGSALHGRFFPSKYMLHICMPYEFKVNENSVFNKHEKIEGSFYLDSAIFDKRFDPFFHRRMDIKEVIKLRDLLNNIIDKSKNGAN